MRIHKSRRANDVVKKPSKACDTCPVSGNSLAEPTKEALQRIEAALAGSQHPDIEISSSPNRLLT